MKKFYCILTLWWLATTVNGQSFRNEWIDYNKTYYKFPVSETRLYRIPLSALTSIGLGNIPAQDFQLWRNGAEVPLFTTQETGPLAADGFIEFYGKMNDGYPDTELYASPNDQVNTDRSYFSDTAWFYLTVNAGKPNLRLKQAANNVAGTGVAPENSFWHIQRLQPDYLWNYGEASVVATQPVRSALLNGGEGWASAPFSNYYFQFYAINVPHADYATASNSIDFSYSISGNYHLNRTVVVWVNDSIVSRPYLTGYQMLKDTIKSLPQSIIKSNVVNFKMASNNGDFWDNSVLNLASIRYKRTFDFDNEDLFALTLASNTQAQHLRIKGFRNGGQPVIVYDLSSSKRYLTVQNLDTDSVLLEPSSIQREVVLAAQGASIKQVSSFTRKNFINLKDPAQQGNYIIISSDLLLSEPNNAIQEYANYRQSEAGGNYNPKILNINELAEQFAFGQNRSPLAIKNYIRFASTQTTIKPKAVFLIGRSTSYASLRVVGKRNENEIIGSLPTFGSPSSDNLLASDVNNSPIPLIPIGRLSAINNEEVRTYLSKVKAYEALLSNPTASTSERDWKKEVIHLIGGDDLFLVNIITNFFNRYRVSITDTAISAKVYMYKRVNNPSFANDMTQIKNRIDNGAGLITYFGHSSSSGIDFNLSSPEEYQNTNGKFPIFIANGCRAGNIFDFNYSRISSKNISVSENFIFAKNKGAISFISNSDLGVINYMHLFTNEYYKQFSRFSYGKTIGEIQQEAIRNTWNITGSGDPLNRINLEQVILHSDPAIVPYPYPAPDYTTSEDQVSFMPVSPNVSNDSIWVKVKFANIGRAVRENVEVLIQHERANGQRVQLLRTTLTNLLKMDSIQVKMGLKGLFDGGTNYLIATIDPDGVRTEFSEQNNSTRKAFDLNTTVLLPVFPYDLSIVQGPTVRLTGSTANPVAKMATYRFQVDTSKNFNSPLRFSKDTNSIGGALSVVPNIAWKTNTVYYWRVSPVSIGVATNWAGASFLYNPTLGSGSNQSHYYQHLQSSLAKMMLGDASNRQFAFQDIPQNLYAEHGIYPTSGTEEGHFSIIVNGLRSIRSACIGSSIIFNVFDGQTFKPWDNSVGGQYGSGYYCGPGREYNFEFYYYSQANRKTIMDFLNIIPKGHYVAARMVLDPPHDSSFAKYWLNDTAMYGKGNSLYHALVKQGFQNIDSLNKPRTFAFFFKKDDTLSFKPVTVFSEGLYDRIQTSQNLYTKDTSGNILSPDYGPATAWKTLTWASLKDADPASKGVANLQLYGKTKTGNYTLLRNLSSAETNVDISSISATTYPYVQLRMHTGDTTKAKPVQLQHWRVTYDPVADGALSAADYWRWTADTLLQLKDSLRLGIAFKNVSAFPMAATNYTLKLGNKNGQEINLQKGSLKSLNAGDTARIYFAGNIDSLLGRYYLRLEVNGAKAPAEQAYFNNLAYMPFDVDSLKDAVQLISFNATPGTNQVNTSWNVALELKVGKYEILHGTDSSVAGMQVVLTQQPVNAAAPQQQYLLAHTNPVIGNNYYRLRITDIYGNVILSKAIEIKVRLLDYTMLPSGNALLHNWKFENEMKLTNYRIEHAVNTGSFAAVATRVATNTGVPETNYTYSHTKPSLGINKYRLAYTDAYGNNYATAEKSITIALQQFNVVVNGKVVDMQWDFTNEINIADYVVESGVDSSKLSPIYTQLPSGNGAGTFTYNYQHGNPPLGYNFYRLRVKDGNGNIVYSPVYKVFVGDATTVIVYPNPFVNEIRIVTGDNSSSWHAELIDAAGRILVNQTGVGSMSIPTGTLLPGVYFIRYQKGDFKLMQKLQKH